MGSQVVIADAEFANAAQTLYAKVRELQCYADYVGACLVDLHESGAIESALTLEAFQERREELSGIAAAMAGCLGNLEANTTGFISDVDAIDTFVF